MLSCLGLFGLSIYTAQRRTKEIGIRKVMGASTGAVMRMLLRAFSEPVLWASLIAWPVAGWVMTRWLEGFVYRVPLGWWIFPVATVLALGITLVTVSVHSYIVAQYRPAERCGTSELEAVRDGPWPGYYLGLAVESSKSMSVGKGKI